MPREKKKVEEKVEAQTESQPQTQLPFEFVKRL